MKKRDCTICVAKTRTLISCAVVNNCTADLRFLFSPMHVISFLMWRDNYTGKMQIYYRYMTLPTMHSYTIYVGIVCPCYEPLHLFK